MTTDLKTTASHILELKRRIIYALSFFGLIAVPLILFAKQVFDFVSNYLFNTAQLSQNLIATEITSPFLVPLKLALLLAFFISAPFWLYQLWAFVTPALYKHEKKVTSALLLLSLVLFYAGVSFSYFLVCPMTLKFFAFMSPDNVQIMTDINHYLGFLTKMIFSFGLCFQVPIVVYMGLKAGIWTEKGLKAKRPYVIVFAFIIGMLLTPPDVISQVMLAVPLCILFELGLFLGKRLKPGQMLIDDTQP